MIYPEPQCILIDLRSGDVLYLKKGSAPEEGISVDINGIPFNGDVIAYKELKYADVEVPEGKEYILLTPSLSFLPKKKLGLLDSIRVGVGSFEIRTKEVPKAGVIKLVRRQGRGEAPIDRAVFIIFKPILGKEILEDVERSIKAYEGLTLVECMKQKTELENQVKQLEVEKDRWRTAANDYKSKYDRISLHFLQMDSETMLTLAKAKELLKRAEIYYQGAAELLNTINKLLESEHFKELVKKAKKGTKEIEELRKEVSKLEREV